MSRASLKVYDVSWRNGTLFSCKRATIKARDSKEAIRKADARGRQLDVAGFARTIHCGRSLIEDKGCSFPVGPVNKKSKHAKS